MVHLSPYRLEHQAALEALHLSPEQLEFTAHPADLLPEVLPDPERLAVTILDGETPVGLFVLSVGPHRDKYLAAPDLQGVALGALSVDGRRQGQGIGTQAMRQLVQFVPAYFPTARHVLLVVNQRNPQARHVYEKVGFQVLNERMGSKGPQWVMHLDL